MIFNNNSTRGHTGSLLVNNYRYVITAMVCGVSVTSANVAPSTVTHGRNMHPPRDIRRCLAILSTERHLTATIVDLNVPTLRFFYFPE